MIFVNIGPKLAGQVGHANISHHDYYSYVKSRSATLQETIDLSLWLNRVSRTIYSYVILNLPSWGFAAGG